MKILLGDWVHFDFDSPVQMTDEQYAQLVTYLKSNFAVVEEEKIDDLDFVKRKRLGERKLFGMKWTAAELELLLGTDTTEELMKKLARTAMSIEMYRGLWVSDFNSWINKNGYELKGNLRELISTYLVEIEKEKKVQKEKKSKYTSAFYCKDCDRLYSKERFSNPELNLPSLCDVHGSALKEARYEKDFLETQRKTGKYSARYNSQNGQPVE